MTASPVPLSIYDLPPLELGGMEARDGFAFQDHIAASFCLDMALDATLQEVWSESQDDITLIWDVGHTLVEFVQVKSSELDQLWTAAKLCEREKKEHGSSRCILEKSLAHDRCRESKRFRIVTARPIARELRVLLLPFDAPGRHDEDGLRAFAEMHELIKPKVADFKSENGNDYTFWTANALWDVRHAEDAVRDGNIVKLTKILHKKDIFPAIDQIEEIYTKLLKLVWDAGRADPRIAPKKKRITTGEFERWLLETAIALSIPATGAPEKLQEKMQLARLAPDVILTALEQRRHYRRERLSAKYLNLQDQEVIEGEVTAVLQRLKSQLDNNKLPDDGVHFHDVCLAELERLREQIQVQSKPHSAFLQGCMYSVTGRCMHRFRRVMP